MKESTSDVASGGGFDLARRAGLQGLPDGNEVLERLGHLQTVNVKVSRVEKVVDPLLAAKVRLGLGQFVVMVWEPEVRAA